MSSKKKPLCGRLMLVLMAVMSLLGGCSSDPKAAPAGPKTCEPGETLLEDGRCQPAGLPLDMQCQPGELALENGGCQPAGLPPDMVCPPGEYEKEGGGCEPAGIPPEMCAAGFMPDGDRGCEPILPADPCPDGMMAIPGETVCREVMPCGASDYGDIPVDATTQYVNAAYAGNDGNGTKTKPWKTIQAGINAAASGAIVAVAAGTYNEDVVISGKPVKLWGRCPGMVEVKGAGGLAQVLQIYGVKGSGTEVHGVSITGPKRGIQAFGVEGIVVERIRIHNTGDVGLELKSGVSLAEVTLLESLVEKATIVGTVAFGAKLTIERSVVRDTKDDGSEQWGDGILGEDQDQFPAHLVIRDSVVEKNRIFGITLNGADALVEATVIRNTQTSSQAETCGGIGVLYVKGPAELTLRNSVVDMNEGPGLNVLGSTAMIESSTVSRNQMNAIGEGGFGIQVSTPSKGAARASVIIDHSLIVKNRAFGAVALAADLKMEGTIIRETLPDAKGQGGRGVDLIDQGTINPRSILTMSASIVENNSTGLQMERSDAVITDSVFRNNNRGLEIATKSKTATRATLVVQRALIEKNKEIGILISGADARLESIVIQETETDGIGGIGVQASHDSTQRANLVMRGALLFQNHHSGLAISGSDAVIEGSVIRKTMRLKTSVGGRGVNIVNDATTLEAAHVKMSSSLIDQNVEMGISAAGSEFVLDNCIIRENGHSTDGIGIVLAPGVEKTQRTTGTIHGCSIENNWGVGVLVTGSDVQIESTVVKDSQMIANAYWGRGIQVQFDDITGAPANAWVNDSLLLNNREAGIFILNSYATIDSTLVRGTTPNAYGENGDGLVATFVYVDGSTFDEKPPSVTITESRIENNARAGIANFGGNILLADSELVCHAFDLNGEDAAGFSWSFDGSHDNKCGCPEPTGSCGAKSAGLEAPTPIIDTPGPLPQP